MSKISGGIVALITSQYMWAGVLGYLVAQVAKTIISSLHGKRLMLKETLTSGGMPSTHSATVVALATVVGLKNGFGSAIFAVAFFFALIVCYDALKVRRAVGEQGAAINRLIQIVKRDARLTQIYLENAEVTDKNVAERTTTAQEKLTKQTNKISQPYFARGHTPLQVLVGALVGVAVGVIVAWIAQ